MRKDICVSRMSDGAERCLATDQCPVWWLAGCRFFAGNGIMPGGCDCRCLRQPIAFTGPVDRNSNPCRVVGGDGARQCANGARDQAAQKQSCGQILEPHAKYITHGTLQQRGVATASIRNAIQDQQAHKHGRQRQTKHLCGCAFTCIDHDVDPCISVFCFSDRDEARARMRNRTSIRR